MKILTLAFLLALALFGQAQTPITVTPGTPPAAAPPPPVPPETVVVEVNGRKYTAAEVDQMIAMLPAQYQQAAHSQTQILSQVFLMQRLAEDGAKAGLDQKPPFKEQLEMQRIQVLSTAELSDIQNTMKITQEEEEKYFKDNPEKFKEIKIRIIYLAFDPTPGKTATGGKKVRTEAEAQAKIEDLAKQIQGGADFGKLARENSDDQASASKDGDFGVLKPDSSYPEAIKTAVYALKQGEVSAPVKQPNGFYLIRAEEISQRSFNDSVMHIIDVVKKSKFDEWFKGMQAQYSVKIENQSYFAPRVPAQLQQVR